jgi:hypothetical protein
MKHRNTPFNPVILLAGRRRGVLVGRCARRAGGFGFIRSH